MRCVAPCEKTVSQVRIRRQHETRGTQYALSALPRALVPKLPLGNAPTWKLLLPTYSHREPRSPTAAMELRTQVRSQMEFGNERIRGG